MDNFFSLTLARAIHVIGVIFWIGGVAFVTTVLIPALRSGCEPTERMHWFERLERRFSFQAKWVTLVTGLSGFYMVAQMGITSRFHQLEFWWMGLMFFVWLVFTLVLFIFEPLFLHKLFHKKAEKNSETAFMWLHRMHKVLLSISLLAVLGAVSGAHGVNLFNL